MSRIRHFFAYLRFIIKKAGHIFLRITIIVISVLTISTILFKLSEQEIGNHISWHEAFWSIFFTLVSADFVDVSPHTFWGKVLITFLVFFGIAFISMVTASLASVLVSKKLKEGKGMKKLKLKDHILICGFNDHTEQIAEEIFNIMNQGMQIREVVLIAEEDENPLFHLENHIHFVKGSPTDTRILKMANVEECNTAIILADSSSGKSLKDADARTILTVLTIESLNRKVYTCAEILDNAHISHLKYAHVDEVITSGEYASKLLANAAFSQGISLVVTDLLTADEGSEIYRIKQPENSTFKDFEEIFKYFREEHNAIVIGVVRDNKSIINPEKGFSLNNSDELVVIAVDKPEIN
jgi:voltage-gated potassium channel